MAIARYPAHLTLVGSSWNPAAADRVHTYDATVETPHIPSATPAQDPLCGVATNQALFDRLEVVARIAPSAPLSFVVVKVHGLAELNATQGHAAGDSSLQAVAREICQLIRPTDLVGRLTGSVFGIVLQGTGATAAAAVAARLGYHLAKSTAAIPPASVQVSASTGTGVNADMLPIAAMDPFDDCG